MNGEIVGQLIQCGVHRIEIGLVDLRVRRRQDANRLGRLSCNEVGVSLYRPGRVEGLLETRAEIVECLLGLFDGEVAALDECFGIEHAHRATGLDGLVHERLGVAGIVALVVTMAAVANEVDDDVLIKLLSVFERQFGNTHAGFGVVGVDVEDRCLDELGDIGRVFARACSVRRGREAELVVDDDVDTAADFVTTDLAEVERFGNDALACKGGVAVNQQRKHRITTTGDYVLCVHLGSRSSNDDRVHSFEVRRIRRERDGDRVAVAGSEVTGLAEVVFHIARALHGVGGDCAFELFKELAVVLADDVDEHVETSAVSHANDRIAHTSVRRLTEQAVEHGDCALCSFDAESLLTYVLGPEELLESLSCVEATEDMALLVFFDLDCLAFDVLLDPSFLFRIRDVGVLDAGCAGVRVAHDAENVRELHSRATVRGLRPEQCFDVELALEVPDGEAVTGGVKLWMHRAVHKTERIEVGNEVAAHSIGVDQRVDLDLTFDERIRVVDRVVVPAPANGVVGHAHGLEHAFVEVVLTDQQFVDGLQEQAAFGALDDSVVVGGSHGDDLRHADLRQLRWVCSGERRWVGNRAEADDHALPRHKARYRLDCADAAGVGEADRDVAEVVERKFANSSTTHEVVKGVDKACKVEVLSVFDARHHQGPRSVLLLDIDCDSETDGLAPNNVGFAIVAFDVSVVHCGHEVSYCSHDCVANDVGKADLAAASTTQVSVDDLAIDLEQTSGNIPEARRCRNVETCLHVLDDLRSDPTQWFAALRQGLCWLVFRCSLPVRARWRGRSRGWSWRSGGLMRGCCSRDGCLTGRRCCFLGSDSGCGIDRSHRCS